MSEKTTRPGPTGNLLLDALPQKERERLLKNAKSVELVFGNVIYEPEAKIGQVYFPVSGIISVLSAIGQRSQLEVGIVGREGMAGLSLFLGVHKSVNRAIVQGEGKALAMKSAGFLKECEQNRPLAKLLQRYTHSFLTQVSQSAVCNRFHNVDARLARWLLMTQDRMTTDEFRLTHEFLSHMLGVRREAVTLSAKTLQENKIIHYSRGKIKVLNRKRLEKVSCDCYGIIVASEQNTSS